MGPPGNIGLKCCSLVKKTAKLLKSRSDICLSMSSVFCGCQEDFGSPSEDSRLDWF